MPIDLLTLPPAEAERLAYAEGFPLASQLFARIDDITGERDSLLDEVRGLTERVEELRNQVHDLRDELCAARHERSYGSDD